MRPVVKTIDLAGIPMAIERRVVTVQGSGPESLAFFSRGQAGETDAIGFLQGSVPTATCMDNGWSTIRQGRDHGIVVKRGTDLFAPKNLSRLGIDAMEVGPNGSLVDALGNGRLLGLGGARNKLGDEGTRYLRFRVAIGGRIV